MGLVGRDRIDRKGKNVWDGRTVYKPRSFTQMLQAKATGVPRLNPFDFR